jgi:hypothetical protein
MKRIALMAVMTSFLMTSFLMTSCMAPKPKYESARTVQTYVTITHISDGKYASVEGYIDYCDIRIPVNNGGTGYYYKKYDLREGQRVTRTVTIYTATEMGRTYIDVEPISFDDYLIDK